MKILFLLTEISAGGAERVVLDLCGELKKRGHQTAVAALKKLDQQNPMVQFFQSGGIELFSLNISKKNPLRAFSLRKIVKDFAPDVVSAHLFHPNIISRLLLRKRKFKLVNTIHIMEIRKKQNWRFLIDRITFKMADVHTAVSQAAANFQTEKLKLHNNPFKIIRNGIVKPAAPDHAKKEELRKKWHVDDCDIVFGCIGRLNHQKGFDILLKMKNAVAEKFKDKKIGLVFIGDGPEKENLQKLAETPPENMKITFAGYSANAASECGAFDVFLMPSRFEGLPLSLIEAASHGMPVVVQNIPTALEVITDYPNAVITDFNNAELAAEAIDEAAKKERLTEVKTPSVAEMTDNYLAVFK